MRKVTRNGWIYEIVLCSKHYNEESSLYHVLQYRAEWATEWRGNRKYAANVRGLNHANAYLDTLLEIPGSVEI